jgi:FkbM family methyltransferase
MRGVLFDDHEVELHPDTEHFGGSFQGYDDQGRLRGWDPGSVRFFYERCKAYKAPHVLDIGASTGNYSLLAALIPEMRVIAFEPQNDVRAVLIENLKANDLLDRVIPQAFALAHQPGMGKIRVPNTRKLSGLACMGDPKRYKSYHEQPVTITSLDAWGTQIKRVDLMKIDTEGAELPILMGGTQFIQKFKPEILIEYDERNTAQFGYQPDMIRAVLEEWGATVEIMRLDLYAYWERP